YVITATFIVTIVREDPTLAIIEPWIWLLVGLTAIPSVALWSWLATKVGLLQALAAACTLEAIGVALSVELPSTLGLVLAATLLGGTFMGITALGLTAARTLSTGTPQRAIAYATASFALGQAIGPVLAGVMVDWLGSFRLPSLIAAAALLISAGLCLWAKTQSPKAAVSGSSG
ncbi:MAG: YbfB/YjiJ family MFS transporter, partial [Pseudomonadota bacterium]